MRILVYDSLFVKGHIHPNTFYIQLLSTYHDVSVVSTGGFFKDVPDKVSLIDVKTNLSLSDIRGSRINQVKFTRALFKQIEGIRYDFVLLLSYDLVSFSIARHFFPNGTRIVIQEHNNIDNLTNRFKLFFYSFYKNKVVHIVYEEYMKDALIKMYSVKPDNIFVLPRAKYAYSFSPTDKKNLAIGLSGSNNDSYINQIIIEANNNPDLLKGKSIVLKTHCMPLHSNESIRIITSRVSDEEYKELFNSTRIVLDPLPATFKYRMSAVMFEALSSRKIVIGSDSMIIRFFSNKYPHICLVATNPAEMIKLAMQVSDIETEEEKKEFELFNSDYNVNATADVFNRIISSSIEE